MNERVSTVEEGSLARRLGDLQVDGRERVIDGAIERYPGLVRDPDAGGRWPRLWPRLWWQR
jgi:hypothetical protein